METVTNAAAIKTYFEADGGRKLTMAEFRALSDADKKELGALCAAALGKTIREV